MPQEIEKQPLSLWSVSLEVHTDRIFEFAIGVFYILIVPIVSIALVFILISGFIIWLKKLDK